MSNFEIHELTEKTINRNSNIIHDTLYGEDFETGKNLAGAVADLASANVAAPYDETVTYAIGQYCLNEGNIYRCIAITTGAFDSTAWVQIVVTGEFRRVLEISSAAYAQLTSAEQNNGTLYVLTDEETTADDIPYSAGESVADKLDDLSTGLFKVVNYSSGNITLNAGGAVDVKGADMGINSFPTGYVPLALVGWYASANGIFARFIDINAITTASFCVLKSVETTTVTFQYQARILYVKSAYAPV